MQLLKHFKELTIHPKNAQELKGLILQLAIQGKLTQKWREQNPDVEPASVLLEKIKAEKEQQKKEYREIKLKNINQKDNELIISQNWKLCRLGEVCIRLIDGNYGESYPKKDEFINEGIPFFTAAAIGQNFEIKKNKVKFITNEKHATLIKAQTTTRDILLTNRGARVGDVVMVKDDIYVNSNIGPQVTRIAVAHSYVKNDYILYCLASPYIQSKIIGMNTGSAMNFMNLTKTSNLIIPLPPLEEQKAIVEIVNQLFTEVEALEAQTLARVQLKEDFVTSALKRLTETQEVNGEWAFLQTHFKDFFNTTASVKKLRESILQLAVQGKLTASWRSQNPSLPLGEDPAIAGEGGIEHAATLLQRIKAEKEQLVKEKKIKKEKPLPAITEEEIPYELPDGWVWCRLGDIAEKLGAGSTPSGGKSAYVDEGIMFFRSQNIHNYFLKLEQVAFIPEETHEKMKGTKVQAKDLLLNITGGSIGRCALVPDDFDTANVSQHVAIVRLIELEFRKYIHSLIVSSQFQQTIMDVQVGVSREGLSMTKLKLFLVPLPPLEEQKAIVAKVNSLMGLCDQLEQQITHNTQQVLDLMMSCLREVFEA